MAVARRLVRGRSVDDLRRAAADALGWGSAFALVVLSARSGGGYFPVEYLTMGIAAAVVAALLVVLRPAVPTPSRRGMVALACLAGFALWTGLSSSWSSAPSSAVAEFQRTLAYVAILALGLVVVGRGRGSRGLVLAVWVALSGVAVAGVASRLLPGLDLAPLGDPAVQAYRLSWPISYWNAQGTASAMAAVLAMGLASDRRSHAIVRGVAAATVPLAVVGVLLTVSRGSFGALLVGVVALIVVSRKPLQTLAVVVCCALPASAGLALASSQPAIVDDPAATPPLRDVGPELFGALLALGAGAAVASGLAFALLRRVERRRRVEDQRVPDRRASTALGVGVAALVLAALVVSAGKIDGSVAGRTGTLRTFVDEQRSTFLDPQSQVGLGVDRLSSAGGSRSDLWRVAIDQFEGQPFAGAGGGSFALRWLRERRTPQPVQNAHSLPLETLAETGIVGLALLVGLFGAIARGAVLGRRRPGGLSRSQSAAVTAGIVTFLVSCAVDWTWQMGTLTAAALLLAGTVLADVRRTAPEQPSAAPGRPRSRRRRTLPRIVRPKRRGERTMRW